MAVGCQLSVSRWWVTLVEDLAVYSPFLISIRPEYLVLVTVKNFGQRVRSAFFSFVDLLDLFTIIVL